MGSGSQLRSPRSIFSEGRKNDGKSFTRADARQGRGVPYKPSSPGVQEAKGSDRALSTPLCAWGHGGGYPYPWTNSTAQLNTLDFVELEGNSVIGNSLDKLLY